MIPVPSRCEFLMEFTIPLAGGAGQAGARRTHASNYEMTVHCHWDVRTP